MIEPYHAYVDQPFSAAFFVLLHENFIFQRGWRFNTDKHYLCIAGASGGEFYITDIKHALNGGLLHLDASNLLQAYALLFYKRDDTLPALNMVIVDTEFPFVTVINDHQHDQRGCQDIEHDLYCRHIKEEGHRYQYRHGGESSHLI